MVKVLRASLDVDMEAVAAAALAKDEHEHVHARTPCELHEPLVWSSRLPRNPPSHAPFLLHTFAQHVLSSLLPLNHFFSLFLALVLRIRLARHR